MTNDVGFTVCSFHLGHENDFQQIETLMKRHRRNSSIPDFKASELHTSGMITLEGKADVYCLHEVNKLDERPLIKLLKEKKFTIVQKETGGVASVIALSSRFKNVVDHSFAIQNGNFNRGVAIATATDTVTKLKVLFVAAQVFSVENGDGPITQTSAAMGDLMCNQIQIKAAKFRNVHVKIIGSNTGVNQALYPNRSQIFTKQGWDLIRTGKPTFYQNSSEQDFIYGQLKAPSSLWFKIKSFFSKWFTPESILQNKVEPIRNWEENFSIHMPVFAKVSFSQHSSKIGSLINKIVSIFRCCRKGK